MEWERRRDAASLPPPSYLGGSFFLFLRNFLREIFLPVALGKTPRQVDPTYEAGEGGDQTLREQQ